ncbi:MAG: hypothetical protein ABI551_10475 [Polyangiaceae bacterium]
MTTLRSALLQAVDDTPRVDRYYLPLAEWVETQRKKAKAKKPFVLGLSGPQGSGKTTFAKALVSALGTLGQKAIDISTDDFYLTRAQQLELSGKHPHDPLFETRGFAGTHDVDLGAHVLGSLVRGAPTKVPRYDKSAHHGQGDRASESEWTQVDVRQDLVVFEGWQLGFRTLPKHRMDEELWLANDELAAYDVWTKKLDALILLEAKALDFIVEWRVGSERARREKGETTMNEADAQRYITRFLPVYRAYVPALVEDPPVDAFKLVVLGKDRNPLAPISPT